jgi:hypothetical protein
MREREREREREKFVSSETHRNKGLWRICKDLLIPLVVVQWLLQSIGVAFEDESALCV